MRGKDNDKSAADMIDCLYECCIDEIKKMLETVPFYSIEFDGLQARKTQVDWELVYLKVVVSAFFWHSLILTHSLTH